MDRLLRLRPALCALALLSCLPYMTLKLVWTSGGEVGIPAGSPLLEPGSAGVMAAVNGATLLMDAGVVVLALALTRPWGRRLPAPLLLAPLWAASGLLGPVLLSTVLDAALRLGAARPAPPSEPFLDAWVFTVVYTGFSLQALALGGLLVAYVGQRWGARLRGGDAAPQAAGPRRPAVLAVALAAVPFTAHLGRGLGAGGGGTVPVSIVMALAALSAGAGALRLGLRPRGPWRRAAVVGTWCGGAALAAWGAWWLLVLLVDAPVSTADGPSALWRLTYAAQVITGPVTLGVLAGVTRRRPEPVRPGRPGC
ncbi:hypothetical protein [Streptomyces chumphonensis]|uniref:hypothetical protein n=1 Tax=Streptomyces chumphonensis TaxID=1214925 RepID=UPI003D74F3DB